MGSPARPSARVVEQGTTACRGRPLSNPPRRPDLPTFESDTHSTVSRTALRRRKLFAGAQARRDRLLSGKSPGAGTPVMAVDPGSSLPFAGRPAARQRQKSGSTPKTFAPAPAVSSCRFQARPEPGAQRHIPVGAAAAALFPIV